MLKSILTKEMIKTNVYCNTWQDAAKFAGQILIDENKVKKEFVQTMIDTVLQYGPYVILVPKIAFFHGLPGDLVNEVSLSLITLNSTVYFSEFDNQPIKCAFAFGAKDGESHMKMIMEIAKLFQDKEFIDLITNNASKSEILKKINDLEEEENETK